MYQSLNDAQWAALEPLFPAPIKRGRGKPHAPWRYVLNSILFVLLTGAKWASLPQSEEFASKSAAHRWFIIWDKNGFLNQIMELLETVDNGSLRVKFRPARRNRVPTAALHSVLEVGASA